MDSFELNKLLGALLGTVFVVFSVGIVVGCDLRGAGPEKPGFAIEAAEAEATGRRRGRAPSEPIAALLAAADPERGRGRLQEMRGLPHRREGRRQQGRPESLGHRQPPGRLA